MDDEKEVLRQIVEMKDMFACIRKNKDENKLFLQNENLASTVIWNQHTIADLISMSRKDIPAENMEAYQLLLRLFNQCTSCNYTYEDMIEVLKSDYEEEELCNGMIVMQWIEGIPRTAQVFKDKEGFYNFRRHLMVKKKLDGAYFVNQIKRYFDCLQLPKDEEWFAHEICETLESQKGVMIRLLVAINNHLLREAEDATECNEFLNQFAIKYNIDDASTQKEHKDGLEICFDDKRVYCGPHLKAYKDDNSRPKHLRIYFKYPESSDSKVYVGLICAHFKD